MNQGANQLVDVENLPDLPKGWVWATTSDVCSSVRDGTHDTPRYVEEGIPLVTSKNLKENGLDFTTAKNISIEDHKKISVRSGVENGDILFAMIGTVGNPVVVQTDRVFSIKNVGLFKRNESFLRSKYLKFWLASWTFNEILEKEKLLKGTTQVFIPLEHLRILPVPVSSLPEQDRIAARIEELFTRLDASVEALKKIKAQLKRYRQAVLRDAFQGKLTQEWREAHKGGLEPASTLLEHIREKHRKRTGGKYRELLPLGRSDIPELPEGWVYLTLDYLVSNDRNAIKRGPFGSSIRKEFFVPRGYKVYEQGNVIHDDFERGSYFIDDRKFDELKDFEVKTGDVLMSCSGTVGKIAIVPEGVQPGVINQALLKVTLDSEVVDTLYFTYLLRSKIDEIMLENTRGSAMINISSVKALRQIPLAIPSLTEQRKIVEDIERHLSIADGIEKAAGQSLKQTQRLRQSVLKTAFEGKLVPQDPSDEPAEKLLQRIKEERTRQQTEAKNTKGGKGKALDQARLLP